MDSSIKIYHTQNFNNSKQSTFKSTANTIKRPFTSKRQTKTHSKIDQYKTLWEESSTSLTRSKGPSFKIPTSQRFSSIQDDERKNRQILSLNISKEIGSKKNVGPHFTSSKRPSHFQKSHNEGTPSPHTYKSVRFMDDVGYKTIENNTQSSIVLSPQIRQSSIQQRSNYKNLQDQFKIKGIKIPKFQSYHKLFIPHSKNQSYQPESSIDNPGVGTYILSTKDKKRQPKYSFRQILKRFNENHKESPSPTTYDPQLGSKKIPPWQKPTFMSSKRDFLTKFTNNPAPNYYSVARFLEQFD